MRGVLAEGALDGLSGKGVVVGAVVERVGSAGSAMGPLGPVAAAVRRLAEGNPRAYSSECALGLQVHPVGTDP